jgi:CopG antitoxin of type II toxin-antitoxin system
VPKTHAKTLTVIHRIDEIPAFANEAEEHAFWVTHELSDELWDAAEPLEPGELPAPRSKTRSVAIRFDEHTLARIKNLAQHRQKGYQTLLKEFVTERLYEEEKRDRLLG